MDNQAIPLTGNINDILSAVGGGPDMTKVYTSLIEALRKSEPATAPLNIDKSAVSSALSNALGGTGLGLSPEQVASGYNTALGSAAADLASRKQAVEEAEAPSKIDLQKAHANYYAGLPAREAAKLAHDQALLDPGNQLKVELAKAYGKGLGEHQSMLVAAKNLDDEMPGKFLRVPGLGDLSPGQAYLLQNVKAVEAAITADATMQAAVTNANSRVEAAKIASSASTSADKMQLEYFKSLAPLLGVILKGEGMDLSNIGKPPASAEAAKTVLKGAAERAGVPGVGGQPTGIPADATDIRKGTYQGKSGTFYRKDGKAFFKAD